MRPATLTQLNDSRERAETGYSNAHITRPRIRPGDTWGPPSSPGETPVGFSGRPWIVPSPE